MENIHWNNTFIFFSCSTGHNNDRVKFSSFLDLFCYFYRINWILEGKWWCCSSGLNRLVLRGQAWGHVLLESSTVFLGACRFRCLLIFRIIILCHCKGVVLANRRLDKFFYFSWIVVYIRIEAQLNVPFCGDYLSGTFVVAGIFVIAICFEI